MRTRVASTQYSTRATEYKSSTFALTHATTRSPTHLFIQGLGGAAYSLTLKITNSPIFKGYNGLATGIALSFRLEFELKLGCWGQGWDPKVSHSHLNTNHNFTPGLWAHR